MARFRVHLQGHNIVVNLDGVRRLVGFRGARIVEADSPTMATERALELIQSHPAVAAPLNGPDDPPPLVLSAGVELIVRRAEAALRQPGLTFYVQPPGELPIC